MNDLYLASIPEPSRIILYGAGNVCRKQIEILRSNYKHQILFIVDRRYDSICSLDGIPVKSKEVLLSVDYDYIIMSVSNSFQFSVLIDLVHLGIPLSKIIGCKNFFNALNDFISSRAKENNIEFDSGHKNRIEDLDEYFIELTNLQNSNYLEKLKNKIIHEQFYIKYPQLAELIKSNKKFKNIHEGKRCFILGNGPSLKEQNLSPLCDEYVFTVNNSYRYEKIQDVKSNYHFYADPMYFDVKNSNESVVQLRESLVKSINGCLKKGTICFLPTIGYDLVAAYNLTEYANIEFYSTPLKFYDGYDEEIDYSCPSPAFNTVVQWCITMSVYMGFKEIYLLGCDCDAIIGNIVSDKQGDHAYDTNEDDAKIRQWATDFYSMEAIFKGWANIFHYYEQLYQYCAKRGIRLINCSAKTILHSLPRMKYENVLLSNVKQFCDISAG